MPSNKFKIGDKVRYRNEWTIDWVYGTVCKAPEFDWVNSNNDVWAYWNSSKQPSWVKQEFVELVKPRVTRNLPAWW